MEDDHIVQAVEELRPEGLLDLSHHLGLHLLIGEAGLALLRPEAEGRAVGDQLTPQIAGHDQDGVAEVDPPPLRVGEDPVVHHLEEDVEDITVGLLDLVEEDHRIRPVADGLGQLPGLLISDIARRGPDEAGDSEPLHVFGHVDPDQRLLIPEEELRQDLREVGLPHPCGAEEEEGGDRPLRVLHPSIGPPDRPGHRLHRLLLVHILLVDLLLHVDHALRFLFGHVTDGDAGPGGDHLGDVHLRDHALILAELRLQPLQLPHEPPPPVAELRRPLIILLGDGDLLLLHHRAQFGLQPPDLRRG